MPHHPQWNVDEFTGMHCDKCGGRMLAVNNGAKGWFSGCENYFATGCRNAKPLPKTKPLVSANGNPIHPVAVENEQAFLNRLSTDDIGKVNTLVSWLDQHESALILEFRRMRTFLMQAQQIQQQPPTARSNGRARK